MALQRISMVLQRISMALQRISMALQSDNAFAFLKQYNFESAIIVDDYYCTFSGTTLERIVNLLASTPRMLWGGLTLSGTSSGHRISRDRTIDFVLMTYRSFMHPIVLMRLLMHRYVHNYDIIIIMWNKLMMLLNCNIYSSSLLFQLVTCIYTCSCDSITVCVVHYCDRHHSLNH